MVASRVDSYLPGFFMVLVYLFWWELCTEGRTFSAPLLGNGEPQLLKDVAVGGQFLGIEFAQGRTDPLRLLEGEVEVDAVFLGAGRGGGGTGDLHGSTLSFRSRTLHRSADLRQLFDGDVGGAVGVPRQFQLRSEGLPEGVLVDLDDPPGTAVGPNLLNQVADLDVLHGSTLPRSGVTLHQSIIEPW